MRIFDVSVPVSPALPVWPGDPPVILHSLHRQSAGDPVNVTQLSCGVHTGTHVDAPFHLFDRAPTVEAMPLDVLIGPVYVAYLPSVREVTPTDLEALCLPVSTTRLVLHTQNSALWAEAMSFTSDYVALTPEAAEWIVRRGLHLIGVDYLSIQRFSDSDPLTHRTLLSAGVVIVEGLNLSTIAPGWYELICLPLKLVGCDGAPARVVLVRDR